MPEDIKSISVSRTITSTEIWTINLNVKDEYYLRLIEDYKRGKINKSELFYSVFDLGPAIWEEHTSDEKFNVVKQ